MDQQTGYIYAIAVSLVCLGMVPIILLIPARLLAKISRWPGCSPNAISIESTFVFWFAMAVFFAIANKPFTGSAFLIAICIFVIAKACLLDIVDGRMARAMVKYQVPRSEKRKELGKWIDPLRDKLMVLPVIFIFSLKEYIALWIAIGIISVDIFGTLMRVAVTIKERRQKKFSDWQWKGFWATFAYYVRGNTARAPGKIKMPLQVIGILLCMMTMAGWINAKPILDTLFGCALIFAMLSVLSRLYISPRINRAVDRILAPLDRLFRH